MELKIGVVKGGIIKLLQYLLAVILVVIITTRMDYNYHRPILLFALHIYLF